MASRLLCALTARHMNTSPATKPSPMPVPSHSHHLNANHGSHIIGVPSCPLDTAEIPARLEPVVPCVEYDLAAGLPRQRAEPAAEWEPRHDLSEPMPTRIASGHGHVHHARNETIRLIYCHRLALAASPAVLRAWHSRCARRRFALSSVPPSPSDTTWSTMSVLSPGLPQM
jgi:hypothetical protein